MIKSNDLSDNLENVISDYWGPTIGILPIMKLIMIVLICALVIYKYKKHKKISLIYNVIIIIDIIIILASDYINEWFYGYYAYIINLSGLILYIIIFLALIFCIMKDRKQFEKNT